MTVPHAAQVAAVERAVAEYGEGAYFHVEDDERAALATALATLKGVPALVDALRFIVEQIDLPGVAEHTLGAYTHGQGMKMGREALAAFPVKDPAP